MAIIQTKYVQVGYSAGKLGDRYGFQTSGVLGDISDTSGGSTNNAINSVYSSTNVNILADLQTANDDFIFRINTSQSNSGWNSIIFNSGSDELFRSDATYATDGSTYTQWTWSFATYGHPLDSYTTGTWVKVEWDDGASSITPPVISSITDDNAAASSVTATVNLSSNGSGGTLQYAQTTTNSVPSTGWQAGSTFSQARGTTRYYWASQDTNTSGAYDGGDVHVVGYIAPDTTITTIGQQDLTNGGTSFDITIANGGSTTVYEVWSTSYGGTLEGSRTGNGTLTVSDFPADNSTKTYYVTGRLPTANGGDNLTDNIQTFDAVTTAAADTTPDAFTFTDVTGATISTEYQDYVQITGINTAATVSRTAGSGTWSVSSTTTPGTFGTSDTSITNNQYLHVKQTSSGSFSTAVSTTMDVGGVSDTYSVTTEAADTTPDAFSFTDVTNASLSTDYESYVQITGINTTATVSRTSGSGVWSVSNTTSPVTYGTSDTSITNNQYLHVKQTSSASNSTAVNTVMDVGGVSDTFTVTTASAASGYSALGGNVTDTALNTYYYATFSSSAVGTTSPGTGLNVGTTVPNGTTISVKNGNWSKDGTTWSTLSSSTVNQNETLYFRALTANINSIKLTHSLTIGTTTYSFSTFTEGPNEYGIQTFTSNEILNFDTSRNIATFYETVSGTLSSGTTTTDITLSTNEIPTTAVVIDLSSKAWLFADPQTQTTWGVLVDVSGTKKLRVSRTSGTGSTSYSFVIVGTELLQNY